MMLGCTQCHDHNDQSVISIYFENLMACLLGFILMRGLYVQTCSSSYSVVGFSGSDRMIFLQRYLTLVYRRYFESKTMNLEGLERECVLGRLGCCLNLGCWH